MEIFRNKIAIVTGGASGIGKALCEELAAAGATVVITDVNESGANQLADRLGSKAHAYKLDVTDADAVQNLVDEVVARHGRLDYMFNNAGVGIAGDMRDFSREDWERIINVNLWGVINGTQAAYKQMARQRSGHIINTASGLGLVPTTYSIPYGVTKYAVVGLSNSLRIEAAELGVKVSVICPGYIDTNIFADTNYVNLDQKKLGANLFKLASARDTARNVLKKVAKNRGVIVYPFYVNLVVWFARIAPPVWSVVNRKLTADNLRARIEKP
jgi:NAD(P)-dependent dehydrogenase (short-subunit alcohol dehydrogenase family)